MDTASEWCPIDAPIAFAADIRTLPHVGERRKLTRMAAKSFFTEPMVKG